MLIWLDQVSFAPSRITQKGTPIAGSEILRNVSFTVNKSDRIAIVGASGSGKTTLLRLINRLAEPSAGLIQFEGNRYQDIPVLQLRQQILFVAQEPKLLGMTVREALSYPLKLRNVREIDQRINHAIDRMSIPREWLDRSELELSTGERQWIAIARALICQPKVLLLDEPIANLDANRNETLLRILTQIESTVLVVTHQLEWAEQFSDRVLQLQQGQLIRDQKRVDWQAVRREIAQAEAEEAAEWD
ncbi:ATP-binding cassette domain-containing protein [Leptolyngbya sp. FACHB-17]|uniref:ABC transporter ATP-binding protein n=1 Tax=unclassified Leptolyngbya TaxID=2650499 RepID=UPI001680FE03|nr:ATP-binding cassette domain-containing protein [Leptolyngbya sp. FACHB-17]MBD2082428.1 ATP-binding cassette domain-containing protein [Leptolyngbya sp. FACHB-17]